MFKGKRNSDPVENKSQSNQRLLNEQASLIIKEIKSKGIQYEVQTDFPAEKVPGHIRFVCISDTHCNWECFKNVPAGDVLIHAGDFTGVGSKKEIKIFEEQMNSLTHPIKVVIAGNHDIPLDLELWKRDKQRLLEQFRDLKDVDDAEELKNIVKNSCSHYLEDSSVDVLGYKIWGSPWQPWFYDWGFNLQRGESIKKYWDMIPNDTEILVTHGPPLGHGDLCSGGPRAGCKDLYDAIENRIKPLYHIFGHIHEGYGVTTNGTTQFVNASSVNLQYKAGNKAIVFDLPVKPSHPLNDEKKLTLTAQQQDLVSVFEKIASKKITVNVLYEDDLCLAFEEINPWAKVHFQVIPKNRDGLNCIDQAQDKHAALLGHMMVTVAKVAKQQGLQDGFRTIINNGEHGCQNPYYLHIHVLGGNQLSWPPGVDDKTMY